MTGLRQPQLSQLLIYRNPFGGFPLGHVLQPFKTFGVEFFNYPEPGFVSHILLNWDFGWAHIKLQRRLASLDAAWIEPIQGPHA